MTQTSMSKYRKREDMALTSKRVRVFLSDTDVTQQIVNAISMEKRGESGTFKVPASLIREVTR
jgi:hypothetical protein